MSECVSSHKDGAQNYQHDRQTKINIRNKKLGVEYHCKNQEVPGSEKSYITLWPWHRHEFKDNKLFSWDAVNFKILHGTERKPEDLHHKLSKFRDWLSKSTYHEDKDAWKAETVLKTGRLPRGMRYAVDWRFIGGIAPIANGKFKEGSIRRFTHIFPTQQCRSTCTITGARNVVALSRIVQLGENARHKELGNSPWCPLHRLTQNRICNVGDALRSYNYIYETKKVLNPDNPLLTWVEVKDDDPTYALNTTNHMRDRELKGIALEEFLDVDDATYYVNEIDNNGGEELGNLIGVDNDVLLEELIENSTVVTDEEDNEEDVNINTGRFRHSVRVSAAKYWSEQINDPYLYPYVNPKYQIPEGTSPIDARINHPNTCSYYATYQCGVIGAPWEKYRKEYGLAPFNERKQKLGCSGDTLELKGNYSGTFKYIPTFKGKKNQGTNRFRPDETGNPLIIGKNIGMFMAGEMYEASPMVYIMAFLDNVGPFNLSNGSLKNSSNDLREFANKLGKTFEKYGEEILFYDNLITGYGDKADVASKVQSHTYSHFQNYNTAKKIKGSASGHTWAVVGYKFLPDDPENSYIIGMNSHTLGGSGPNQRGVFILRFPFVVGVMGPNEFIAMLSQWTDSSLPMKYYYDGTEEVPGSARGGTNEVRGYDKYDWRQTVDFDKSGKSLENVGDGSNGNHCGLGSNCQTNNTGFVRRPLYSPDTSASNSANNIKKYKQLDSTKCNAARAIKATTGLSLESCKTVCDKVVGCNLFEYYQETERCVFFRSCELVNNDLGIEVYDKTVVRNTGKQQTFIVDNWYHTRPNCMGTFSIPTYDAYVPIGGGCKIADSTLKRVKNLEACRNQCDKVASCEIFSYELSTKTCRINCLETKFSKHKQDAKYMPSCDVVTYRKREPLNKNAITRKEDYLAQSYTGYINGRCYSNKLVRNVFSANLTECMLACDEHRFCQYFEQIGPSCFLYDDCNMGPAEYGDAMYNVNVSYPANFVAYEKQEIGELLPFANYDSLYLIPKVSDVQTPTFSGVISDDAASNSTDVFLVSFMFCFGTIFGLFGIFKITQDIKNSVYKKVYPASTTVYLF